MGNLVHIGQNDVREINEIETIPRAFPAVKVPLRTGSQHFSLQRDATGSRYKMIWLHFALHHKNRNFFLFLHCQYAFTCTSSCIASQAKLSWISLNKLAHNKLALDQLTSQAFWHNTSKHEYSHWWSLCTCTARCSTVGWFHQQTYCIAMHYRLYYQTPSN